MTDERSDEDDDLDIPSWIGAEPARRSRRPSPSSTSTSTSTEAATRPLRIAPGPIRAASSAAVLQEDPYDPFLLEDTNSGRGYVRLPRRHRGVRRVAVGGLAVFALIVLSLGGAGLWLVRQLDPSGQAGDSVVIDLPLGATTPDIARLLDDAGVVKNRTIFEQYLKLKGPSRYQSGKYSFVKNSSMSEAVAAVVKGPIPAAFVQVTLPEGLRVDEIRTRLLSGVPWFEPAEVDAVLLANTVRSRYQPGDVASLEGLVFPETYRIEEGSSAKSAVTQMLAQFDQVAAEIKLDSRAGNVGLSPYQVIIVASMIEREARLPEDRPKIARVIYNRLAEKMRLDIDATVVYAVGGRTPLTGTDLEIDSPYNTRRYKGLPPTPIAAPGQASLEAALAPSDGPWLYYVLADREGRHYFTESATDFDRAVAEADEAGLLG